jgi:putative sterol carrier protein
MFRLQDDSADLRPLPEEYLADPRRYFDEYVPRRLAEDSSYADRLGDTSAVAQLHLTGDRGGSWHFVVGNGRVEIDAGNHRKPTFTVTMPVDTWRQMRRGEITGMRAFMRGQVRIKGSKLRLFRLARRMR